MVYYDWKVHVAVLVISFKGIKVWFTRRTFWMETVCNCFNRYSLVRYQDIWDGASLFKKQSMVC